MARFLMFFMLVFVSISFAKEYGHYDREKIFLEENGFLQFDGKIGFSMLRDLESHASSFPVSFDSDADKQRAKDDLVFLSNLTSRLDVENSSMEMLAYAAIVNFLAYNFDINGSFQEAKRFFEAILKKNPNDAYGNYKYGIFLANAGKTKESIPYHEKAVQLGAKQAYWGLSMSYWRLNDKAKAMTYMQEYVKNFPNDKNGVSFLNIMKNYKGDVQTKQMDYKN